MKKFKINKMLLASAPMALAIIPFGTAIQAQTASERQVKETLEGFDLRTEEVPLIDSQIVRGSFKEVNYFPELTTNEPNTVTATTGRISRSPKTYIYSPYFTINFVDYVPLPGEDQTPKPGQLDILTASLKSSASGQVQRVHMNSDVREIVSTQLLGQNLWMIVKKANGTYGLCFYTLENQSSGYPTITGQGGTEVGIPINAGGASGSGEPVIVPIYEKTGNKLVPRSNEILVYRQNENFATNNSLSTGLQRFHTKGKDYYYPTNKPLSIGTLPNTAEYNNSQVLSLLAIDNKPFDPTGTSTPDLSFGAYHTKGTATNTQVVYSTFRAGGSRLTETYNEVTGEMTNIHLDSLMPYPKVVSSKNGFELLWILSRTYSASNSGSRIYSTSINSDFAPNDNANQAKVIDLSTAPINWRNLRFIDYRDNGVFDNGNVYIPVKFESVSTVQWPGVINWKDTKKDDYWNNDLTKNMAKLETLTFSPDWPFFAADAALNSAYLQTIGDDGQLTYLFNNIDNNAPITPGTFFRQTRVIDKSESEYKLKLDYNTKTPKQIISNTRYSQDVTTKESVLTEIKKYSTNFLRSGSLSEADSQIGIVGDLKFSEVNGTTIVEAKITYVKGTYENGVYKSPANPLVQHDVQLFTQPVGQLLPLTINLTAATGSDVSPNALANSINERMGNQGGLISPELFAQLIEDKTLGAPESGALIEISEPYLQRIMYLKATANEMNGKVEIETSFLGVNGQVSKRSLTISGLVAIENIIIIAVPIAIVAVIAIIATILIVNKIKRKKVALGALQAGMSLNQKMQGEQEVDPSAIHQMTLPTSAVSKQANPQAKKVTPAVKTGQVAKPSSPSQPTAKKPIPQRPGAANPARPSTPNKSGTGKVVTPQNKK